jgi:multicomponent Na+:H+ antiporter subunit D
VFTLALVFPGAPVLAVAGAVMALYGALFAFMENDIRRLLAYHIISQVGYMVCGVGIGSELALNGATAHAFSHILYKATLFMGAGAVIYATGRRQLTELGGIWKRMPLVTVLFMIAAFSISGVPLWNGFISKSMIISAASEGHLPSLELALTLASVGTTLHTMLKLPWFTFFGEDRGLEVRPLPRGMLVAMGIGAGLCTLFGVWPDLLYRLLPHPVDYHPYTRDHVVGALQLILATGLAFFLFLRYFTGHHAFTRDTDTLYRGAGRLLKGLSTGPLEAFGAWKGALAEQVVVQASGYAHHPERLGDLPALRPLARWLDRSQLRASAGAGAAVAMLALGAFLLLYYLG